jgi:hypothetical protein
MAIRIGAGAIGLTGSDIDNSHGRADHETAVRIKHGAANGAGGGILGQRPG